MKKLFYYLIPALLILFNGNTIYGQKLFRILKSFNIEKFQATIAEKPELLKEKNKYGQTILQEAAFIYSPKYSYDFVKIIVEHGADVNEKSPSGNTALINAAKHGNLETVKYLVSKGAEINAKDKIYGYAAIREATLKDKEDVVKYLVESGANVNDKSNDSSTVLFEACYGGYYNLVELFVSKGADVNITEGSGYTPLQAAIMSKSENVQIVDLLLLKGADVNAHSKDINPSIHIAILRNYQNIARSLLNKGVNVNVKNNLGFTVLMATIMSNTVWPDEIVSQIILQSTDINVKDNDNWAPLHMATEFNLESKVKLLVENNADINLKGKDGITPLMIAAGYGYESLVNYFISKGADLNIRNDAQHSTALTIAKNKGFTSIYNIIKSKGGTE